MRYHRHHSAKEEEGINMTPMLDIVFIMLIFFIVSTSFSRESGVTVNRPSAKSTQIKNKGNNIFVAIKENEDIWIDKRLIDLRAVRPNLERLKIQHPDGAVIIQADKDSRTGLLVQVMDQIRMAGISDISIAAEADSQ